MGRSVLPLPTGHPEELAGSATMCGHYSCDQGRLRSLWPLGWPGSWAVQVPQLWGAVQQPSPGGLFVVLHLELE